MSRNATASVAITANIQAYAQEIGKLPDVTSEAAIKAGAKLEAQFQKRLDAVAKEAKQAAAQVTESTGKATEGAMDAGRAISGIEGVGRIFGGTIGEVTGALGDMEAVFSALPLSAGAAGLALAGLVATLGYLYESQQKQREAAEETVKGLYDIEFNSKTLDDALKTVQSSMQGSYESTRALADAKQLLALAEAQELAPAITETNYAQAAAIELDLKRRGVVGQLTDAERKEVDQFAIMAAQQAEHGTFMENYNKYWLQQTASIIATKQAVDEYGNSIYGLTQQQEEAKPDNAAAEEAAKQREAEARRARAEAAQRQRQAEAERRAAEAQRKAEQARAAAAKKREEAERKAAETARKAAEDLAATLEQLYEIQNRGQLDFLSEEQQVEAAYYRQIEAIRELAKAQEGNAQVQAEAQAAELAALGEYQIKVKEIRDAADAERLEKERQTSEQIKALREEELNALAENQAKQREALFNTIQVGLEAASEVSGLIQEVMAEYAQSYDTTTELGRMAARKQFAINKAFALGDIAIKTAQAVVGFLAMVPPNPVGAVFAGVTGATQAAIVAARQPTFHVGRFTRQGNLVTDEQPAILRRGEVVVPSPMVAAAGGPEAVRERLQGGGSSPNVMLVADFQDRRVTVPLARAVRSANRPGAVGWRR
jgi:hypothetical protein